MSATTLRTPSYRHHKPSGQAVVTLDGRDIYLGRYGTPQSRAEFDRLLAEWLSNGRRLPAPASAHGTDLSVNELSLAYLAFADGYYTKRGKPTSEPGSIRQTIRPLRQLYGHTLAREFGPLQLKAVRQAMIDAGLCRNEVNKRTGRIVRLFKWAVGEGIVPPSLHHGLIAVSGLRRGRADVRESEPVKPVPDAFVDAIRPHVPPQLWAMVELMRLSGMRPQEVCLMRTIDIDRSGRVWILHAGDSQDGASRPGASNLSRPDGPRDPPAVAPDGVDGLPVLSTGGDATPPGGAETEPEKQGPTVATESKQGQAKAETGRAIRYPVPLSRGCLRHSQGPRRGQESRGAADRGLAPEPTPAQCGDPAPSGVRPGRGPGRVGPFLPGRDGGLRGTGRGQSGGGDGDGCFGGSSRNRGAPSQLSYAPSSCSRALYSNRAEDRVNHPASLRLGLHQSPAASRKGGDSKTQPCWPGIAPG